MPLLIVGLALIGLSGCVYVFRTIDTTPIDTDRPPTTVVTPVKAHMTDGSVALFRSGATFTADTIHGDGWQYGLVLDDSTEVQYLPLDSVAALETYRQGYRSGASLLVSTVATGAGMVGGIALFKALFGSCPTVYSQGDSLTLEAESFSNSIVPLFEMRDVDALTAQANAEGTLTLEIRNEALETHYINHLELIDVRHAPHEEALPAEEGRAWVVGDVRLPSRMYDRSGRDVSDVLATADGEAYRTPVSVLSSVDSTQLMDYIDLALAAPVSDTAVVILQLRNSLLHTLLLYDYMLAGQGAEALNWLGADLSVISTAVELSDFYSRRMGLRVHLLTDGTYREVGRVREVGPIAWSREGVAVPVPAGADSLHLRLSFVTDAWRIDEVSVAHETRLVYPQQHKIATVQTPEHSPETALARLSAPDHDYWVTLPTDRFWVTFQPGSVSPGRARTFFLAAQGYYTEWIRRSWLDGPLRTPPSGAFTLNDRILLDAIYEWHSRRHDFEAEFEASKVPVR